MRGTTGERGAAGGRAPAGHQDRRGRGRQEDASATGAAGGRQGRDRPGGGFKGGLRGDRRCHQPGPRVLAPGRGWLTPQASACRPRPGTAPGRVLVACTVVQALLTTVAYRSQLRPHTRKNHPDFGHLHGQTIPTSVPYTDKPSRLRSQRLRPSPPVCSTKSELLVGGWSASGGAVSPQVWLVRWLVGAWVGGVFGALISA